MPTARHEYTQEDLDAAAAAGRERGLNEALFELALMYNKATQATPLHKGMRMALSSASDRVKALMQPNTEVVRREASERTQS